MIVNRILSPTAHVTGVNVTTTFPQTSLREVPEAAARARELAAGLRARSPDLDVYLTGTVMFNNAYAEYGQKDMQTLVPIMFGIILLITFVILRSIVGTVVTLTAIVLSIGATMGLSGWLGLTLTPVSVAAPTIILTVAVADAIHLLLSVLHGMRHGLDKRAAIVEAFRLNLRGLSLTAANTIVGFLSLNASDSPPYRDLGNMVAMGVAVAFALTIFFLPALLSVLPLRVRREGMVGELALDRLADWVIHRRRGLLWSVALGALVVSGFSLRNEMFDDFLRYFDGRTEIRQHNDFSSKHLTGSWIGDYSVGAGRPGGITDPVYLEKLEEFVQWYRRQPGVAHVFSITDIVKRLNKNMHGDDPAFYRVPDDSRAGRPVSAALRDVGAVRAGPERPDQRGPVGDARDRQLAAAHLQGVPGDRAGGAAVVEGERPGVHALPGDRAGPDLLDARQAQPSVHAAGRHPGHLRDRWGDGDRRQERAVRPHDPDPEPAADRRGLRPVGAPGRPPGHGRRAGHRDDARASWSTTRRTT